jgi:hypothetical protein
MSARTGWLLYRMVDGSPEFHGVLATSEEAATEAASLEASGQTGWLIVPVSMFRWR